MSNHFQENTQNKMNSNQEKDTREGKIQCEQAKCLNAKQSNESSSEDVQCCVGVTAEN